MTRNPPPRIYQIAVAVEPRDFQWRNLLSGIFRAEGAHHHWQPTPLLNEVPLSLSAVRQLTKDGIDGLIALYVDDQRVLDALATAPFKTFVIDIEPSLVRRSSPNLCYYDNSIAGRATGAFGFNHLHDCGDFREYLFVPSKVPTSWSDHRAEGFVEAAKNAGHLVSVLARQEAADAYAIAKRLRTVTLPCAIMGACDTIAINILDACRLAGLAVPSQAVVLGVDNDSLLCAIANPPISSIGIDHELLGTLIANGLDALLHHRNAPRVIAPASLHQNVFERTSTRTPLPAAQLIRRALDFIETHATNGISVDDVIDYLGVSRRLAFLRFAQLHHESIGAAINTRRLTAAVNALQSSSLPIRDIARTCGFAKSDTFERLFKRRYGISVGEWRATQANRGGETRLSLCAEGKRRGESR